MALRLGALRDALVEAGASPEKAERASEEIAGYESRLASTDTRLATLTWMVSASIGLLLFTLGSMVALWAKLGEISGQPTLLVRSTGR